MMVLAVNTVLAVNEIWWYLLIVAVLSYAVGNINFAVILSKRADRDIRTLGSGNPGTMNMLRNYGVKLGGITLLFDIAKGALPTLITFLIFYRAQSPDGVLWRDILPYVAGFCCVLGHNFPIVSKFKGGKGVASSIGMFLVMSPVLTLITIALIILFIYLFEYGSIGSLGGITVLSIYTIIYTAVLYRGVFAWELGVLYAVIIMLGFLMYWSHRTNINRLIHGKENRTKLREMLRRKKAKGEDKHD